MTSPAQTNPATLQSFVPRPLIEWLDRDGLPERGPVATSADLVIWMADLVRFTPLSEELVRSDHRRTEAVKDVLNEFFDRATDSVTEHGGSVLRFMGDAVLAAWRVEPGEDRAAAVKRAAHCALDVQSFDIKTGLAARPSLEVRVGIGIGDAFMLQVGGVDNRWEFLTVGSPFIQLSKTLEHGDAGDVVLSTEAWNLISHSATGTLGPDGTTTISSLTDPLPSVNAPAKPTEVDPAHIRRFIDEPVIHQFTASGQLMAGFRSVVSMFINLPSVEASTELARNKLQSAVEATQRALSRYGGTLNRVAVDEKGTTIIAVFGLLRAHPEDAYRAVLAATEIDADLQALQMERGIGIATGQAFCGAYGNDNHRDYTMMGPSVNLAARFMEAERNRILCDGPTARDCRKKIHFQSLEPKTVKGFDEPVPTFTPLWKYDLTDPALSAVEDSLRGTLIGRQREHGLLTEQLKLLKNERISGVVMLEGDAGYGKSALGADLVELARSEEVTTLVGSAEPVEPGPPFHAWKPVLEQLFDLAAVPFKDRRREIVVDRLADHLKDRAPFLNAVLDVEFEENDTTRLVTGSNRRDATVELIVDLLAEVASHSPLLILLDDAHWFDSASWALARSAVRKVQPLLLVILSRPVKQQAPEMVELIEQHDATFMHVTAMGDAESLQLARFRLGASRLTPDVERLFIEHAEGHPFLIEELAYSLMESDSFQVTSQGEGILLDAVGEHQFAGTSHGMVVSRLDQLEESEKRTLSTAAVIGRTFDLDMLAAVHLDGLSQETIGEQLEDLEDRNIATRRSDGTYSFVHQITREAAYEQLPFENRQSVHRAIAARLETESSGEPRFELLAHHWDLGNEPERAVANLEASANRALRRGTSREVVEFHQRSLALVAAGDIEASPFRQSQWFNEIGLAHQALGELRQAERAYYRSLKAIDIHVPRSTLGRVGRLLWELVKQTAHIAVPASIRRPDEEAEIMRLAQASRVSASIAEVYYFVADLLGFPLLSFISINLGDRANRSIVAGSAYSSIAYLLGTMRLRGMAMRYFARAREAAEFLEEYAGTATAGNMSLEDMGPSQHISPAWAEGSYYLTFNEWDTGSPIVDEGIRRSQQRNDKYAGGIGIAIGAFGAYMTGSLHEAVERFDDLLRTAQASGSQEHEAWAASLSIPALLGMEKTGAALARAGEASNRLDGADPLTIPIIHGTRAQALLRKGRLTDARLSAEAALDAFDRTPIYIRLAGIAGMLETFLTLWEDALENGGEARELERLTKKSLSILGSFALVMPFARAKHRWFEGRTALLQGKTSKARKSFRKGLRTAEAAGLTWDRGLLSLELASTHSSGDPERQDLLDAAREYLGAAGSTYDLRRLAEIDS